MSRRPDIPPQPSRPGSTEQTLYRQQVTPRSVRQPANYTVGQAALDILTKGLHAFAGQMTARQRLEICQQCPSLVAGKCRHCGCQMSLKVNLAYADCPLGKW